MLLRIILLINLMLSSTVFAHGEAKDDQGAKDPSISYVRWEKLKIKDGLKPILARLNRLETTDFSAADFLLFEDTKLKAYGFKTYLQLHAGVPIENALIRTWTQKTNKSKIVRLVQMEAHLDSGALTKTRDAQMTLRQLSARKLKNFLSALPTHALVHQVLSRHDDSLIKKIKTRDVWHKSDLQQVVTIHSRRGVHTIRLSHFSGALVSADYRPYAQADIEAMVYPIYEEPEKFRKIQERVRVKLKNLNAARRDFRQDPYAPLLNMRYFEDMIDPVRGETEEGRSQGYWSPNWLLSTARQLFLAAPKAKNRFAQGLYLEGKYATVSLHPDVVQLNGIQFPLTYSGQLNFIWRLSQRGKDAPPAWEVIPASALRGQPLSGKTSALERSAERLPDHNPVAYINSGFDEVQVYYAVDRLMVSLHKMGFTDPELSTRPFHAFLYDPDISMRNNAYYTSDTINFTTYSGDNQNYARDNATIWHELGHGVMDRLMGDLLHLADSGGLSEGMADFVAHLVIEDVTKGADFDGKRDFRIENHIGFHLTNESHDDGEAYGGAMKDILDQALAKYGRKGLHKVSDLTLDAMRLTRNHPALTANDWFEHMLFADQLGRKGVRAPSEMQNMILNALQSRNFRLDRGPVADFNILVDNSGELTSSSLGSRYRPYRLALGKGEFSSYKLNLKLVNSDSFQFKYPVTIEVNYNGSPLQGPVRWLNEEKGPVKYVLNSPTDLVSLSLTALSGCEEINRENNSCHDYTHIQVYNKEDPRPIAKKRFYVQVQ